jgi:hypothetical protein
MKSTPCLTVLSLTFLITGCGQTTIPPEVEPAEPEPARFCDVEEPRRFSQEELDWRSVNAPWNLRRDFKTNTTWDRECVDDEATETGN